MNALRCPRCGDTGYLDYPGFAMDPCDHSFVAPRPEKHELEHRYFERLITAFELWANFQFEKIRAGRSPASTRSIPMDRYIGTKQLTAMPLSLGEYNRYRGWQIPANEDPKRLGYLVKYEDGYESWSPAEVFEAAYARVDQAAMSFGHAVELMKQGKRVTRAGWNGKGMFAYLVPPASYPVQTGAAKEHFGEGSLVPYRAYLALKTVDEDVATWAPSVSDVLAHDWMTIDA